MKNAFFAIFVIILSIQYIALSEPIDEDFAQAAALGWLKSNPMPMNIQISGNVTKIVKHADANSRSLFYTVELAPSGFMILSIDDRIEPVVAFSSKGFYQDSNDNPLIAILEKDMTMRLEIADSQQNNADFTMGSALAADNRAKWQSLYSAGIEAGIDEMQMGGVGIISDVWVEPFVMSQWDQDDADGGYCYNYYTPNNYLTGCVATAMAQLMRYHTWPQTGIGVHTYEIKVNSVPQDADTRGGDGAGGSYLWSQMPYVPANGLSETQRQAIGALCYDAGVSVEMSYTSGASSASLFDADREIVSLFNYSNSIYGNGFSSSGDDQLWAMINCNLDAQLPVIMGISRTGGGHAVVVDGYGYNSSTMYHHLNMGWGGYQDAWYNLPLIDAGSYTYTVIDDVIYNVYTSGSGEIISGRVTSMSGLPLENASVTAYQGTTAVMQTATDSRGIYALKKLSSDTQYLISTVKSGYIFNDQYVTTGQSSDSSAISGNRWEINFVSTTASPPDAYGDSLDVNSTDSVTITLLAVDDGMPDPPGSLEYVITSLPGHGYLDDPGVGAIENVPYTLASGSDQVQYSPCPYYDGEDSFSFVADDGGSYPYGGNSNTAEVIVDVNNQLTGGYAEGTNNYLYGMIFDTESYYDSRMQVIYTPADIGSAMKITSVSLKVGWIQPGLDLNNWTIRMQHTDWNEFSDPQNMLLSSGWTVVYQTDLSITESGWLKFTLDETFSYDGAENLIVDFSYNNSSIAGPDGLYGYQPASGNRSFSVGSQSGNHGDPLTWEDYYGGKYYNVSSSVPAIKFGGVVAIEPVVGDFDLSCDVGMIDFAIIAKAWNTQLDGDNYDDDCDIASPKDYHINLADLEVFVIHWLQSYD